ncbi:putative cytochrome P450 301a1, mitochondrial [Oratosquilla oratoria]|uniref:putative cytochrome P450 301a1, mitochondrial n=1 Tax=Oratosquilla oratoria TaxID=337810 RepID=UPI003F76B619
MNPKMYFVFPRMQAMVCTFRGFSFGRQFWSTQVTIPRPTPSLWPIAKPHFFKSHLAPQRLQPERHQQQILDQQEEEEEEEEEDFSEYYREEVKWEEQENDPRSPPRPASQIPGPKSLPLVGSMPYMLAHKDFDPQRIYLYWQAVAKEYGPIFRKDMPGHPNLVFVTHPDDLEVMHRATLYNPVRPGMTSLKKIRLECTRGIFRGRGGILCEQGEEWKRVRSRVQRPVSNLRVVSQYLPQVDGVALDFINRIETIKNDDGEVPEDFLTELYKWSLEALSVIVLNRRLGLLQDSNSGTDATNFPEDSHPLRLVGLVQQLLEALHQTENVKLWKYFETPSIRRLREAHDAFVEMALQAIAETRMAMQEEEPGRFDNSGHENISNTGDRHRPPNLLRILLDTPGLSQEDVTTFLIDLIATGIDTTAHSMANTLYMLARNPEAQRRLQQEVDQAVHCTSSLADATRVPKLQPQQLASLPYLRAVLKETLRMLPPGVGTTRRLEKDTVICNFLVPRGWQVVAPSMLLFRNEDIFPRANEFLPERWLKEKKDSRSGTPEEEEDVAGDSGTTSVAPRHKFASLPFSYGPRMCIGRRIAEQEMYALLVRIFQHYHVDYKYEDIYLINKLGYAPSHPLRFQFTRREVNLHE